MDRAFVQAFAKKAESLGKVMYFIDTAGASPNQASPEHIVKLDLIVTAVAIDEFAKVICRGGARINTISPGIIVTPLAYDEFNAAGEGYQRMIAASAAKRVGTADEIAEAGAFLLGEYAGFITGTDLLIDGGVIAAMKSGMYSLGM